MSLGVVNVRDDLIGNAVGAIHFQGVVPVGILLTEAFDSLIFINVAIPVLGFLGDDVAFLVILVDGRAGLAFKVVFRQFDGLDRAFYDRGGNGIAVTSTVVPVASGAGRQAGDQEGGDEQGRYVREPFFFSCPHHEKDRDGGCDDQQGYGQYRPVSHPGEGDHHEAPYDTDERSDQTDACADDLLHERDDGEDRAEEAQQALVAGDYEDDAKDAEQPEDEFVGFFLVLDHVLSAHRAHLHFRERLAILGDVALESSVDDFFQDGNRLGRGHLVEGDADIADVRRFRIGTDVDLVAADGHHDRGVGHLGQQLFRLFLGDVRLDRLFARDGADDAVGQLVGAEGGGGCILVEVFDYAPDKVLAFVVGILEFIGIDR